MRYNQLGNSAVSISSIGFGTMSLDLNRSSESDALLRRALDQGINYFDTADLYDKGLNEVFVGKTLKAHRKDIVLATKGGNRWRADGSGWDWDVSPAYIRQAVEDSLSRLQTDYIDLYQIHGGTIEDDFEEVIATLADLVSQGKIRNYGISSIRPNVFSRYCAGSAIVSNMMQYSILDNRPEDYFVDFESSNVCIIARGVLAQGILIDKAAKPYLGHSQEEVAQLKSQLDVLSKEHKVSMTTLALAYVLQRPTVASALLGIRTLAQLDAIIDAYKSLDGLQIDFSMLHTKRIQYKEHL